MTATRRSLLALTILLAACGANSTSESTSATEDVSTSITDSSTTTSLAVTTTASSTTSTTTTTTLIATTTTSSLEGNWAEKPLVAYDGWGGIALGWWDGTAWAQVEAGTELPISGGEDYQVALLGSDALVVGGAPGDNGCDIVMSEGLPSVPFDNGDALHATIDDGSGGERSLAGVAISAPWDITPRPVTAGETHPDFEDTAIRLLEDREYSTPTVDLVQAVDADLEGDGTVETIVVAEDTELANETSGVYSLVFAVSPSWDGARVITESVIPVDDSGYPASFRISAVADLSGDGMLEVVLDGLAWETGWVSVHELTDSGFEERIGAGCGV